MIEKDSYITKVFFKEVEGDVIAVFPDTTWTDNTVASYMHIGQHGGASLELMTSLPDAKDYKDLFEELEESGYNLELCSPTYYKVRLDNL